MASHKEDLRITAFSIMTRQNIATITVRAFFSVKYFFIAVDLHEEQEVCKYKIDHGFFREGFGRRDDFFD